MRAHWCSQFGGGRGAAREACELILLALGKLDAALACEIAYRIGRKTKKKVLILKVLTRKNRLKKQLKKQLNRNLKILILSKRM